MIKIGDFSKLSLVSIKTLRYYDEMGLLKPINVDRFTGYRYYSASRATTAHYRRAGASGAHRGQTQRYYNGG